MRASPFSLSVAVVLLLAAANAGVSARQAQQEKPLSPADRAFRDALNTKEAAARLAAFRTLVAEFPDSDVVKNGAPQFNIFSLATNLVAAEAKEAHDAAEAYAARFSPADRGRTAWANTPLAMALARTEVMCRKRSVTPERRSSPGTQEPRRRRRVTPASRSSAPSRCGSSDRLSRPNAVTMKPNDTCVRPTRTGHTNRASSARSCPCYSTSRRAAGSPTPRSNA